MGPVDADTRLAVVLAALGFARALAVGGTVLLFLVVAGGVSGRAAVVLGVAVVAGSAVVPLAMLRLARRRR